MYKPKQFVVELKAPGIASAYNFQSMKDIRQIQILWFVYHFPLVILNKNPYGQNTSMFKIFHPLCATQTSEFSTTL